MAKLISAVDIKKLWHCAVSEISADLTGTALKTLLASSSKVTEVKNIHQDTWQLEEAESSQDSYTNQLTGSVYRVGAKTMGEITVSFTIGQYDYATKAALLGGTEIGEGGGWKRARGIITIEKAIIALTEDDQYVVFPKCAVNAREANSDGAIGISVSAKVLEPDNEAISAEYWFDTAEVNAETV